MTHIRLRRWGFLPEEGTPPPPRRVSSLQEVTGYRQDACVDRCGFELLPSAGPTAVPYRSSPPPPRRLLA